MRLELHPPITVGLGELEGIVVVPDALAKRLEQGDVIAALDVFDEEPLSKDHVLRNLPNTYLTPHRGGGLVESLNRCVGWLVDDLQALQRKERRLHAMDQSMLIALGG